MSDAVNSVDDAGRLSGQARVKPSEASDDWERLFDAIDDPMCVVAADYRLLYTNAAYRRLFGASHGPHETHYCFARDVSPGAAQERLGPCVDCPLPETVHARRPGFAQHTWRVTSAPADAGPSGPDGPELRQTRLYQRWTYPVVAADGTVDRVVEVLKDVTEQERMRQAVARTEALREADREADRLKAELLGTVSHELRSPLTAIKGYAATLLRHERRLPREERREFLEAIGEASDRLEAIINRLLELSQLEIGSITPHLAPVDVAHVAGAAINAAERKAESSALGHYHFALHQEALAPVVIEADQRLLYDALDNLLENAVKYTPEGGDIDVILSRRTTQPAEGAPHPLAMAETLDITVRDTGLGIPEEHLGRVFERFHRVDTRLTREVDGLGLGLAMCKRIAELHGGDIWVESAPGSGSAFHLALPVVGPGGQRASGDTGRQWTSPRDSSREHPRESSRESSYVG